MGLQEGMKMGAYYRLVVGEADATISANLAGHPDEDIPGGATVTYDARSADGAVVIATNGSVVDVTEWIVQTTFADTDLDTAGRLRGRFQVNAGDGRIFKFPGDVIDIIADRAEA
jgi:hypothetical protein